MIMYKNLVLNVLLGMKVIDTVISIVMRFIITSYHQVTIIFFMRFCVVEFIHKN